MSGAALVLAGGRSRRLGRDKASEPLLGVPLLLQVLARLDGVVDERIVVRRPEQALPPLPDSVTIVEDAAPDLGPLAGLCAGLAMVAAEHAVAFACDMPLLEPQFVSELLRIAPGADAVVPVCDGRPQPLCAAYARRCLPALRRQLRRRNLRLTDALDALQTRYLQQEEWRPFDAEGRSFFNLNSEADLARAATLLGAPTEACSRQR